MPTKRASFSNFNLMFLFSKTPVFRCVTLNLFSHMNISLWNMIVIQNKKHEENICFVKGNKQTQITAQNKIWLFIDVYWYNNQFIVIKHTSDIIFDKKCIFYFVQLFHKIHNFSIITYRSWLIIFFLYSFSSFCLI